MLLLLQALESLAIYLAIFVLAVLAGIILLNLYKLVCAWVNLRFHMRAYREMQEINRLILQNWQEGREQDHAEP